MRKATLGAILAVVALAPISAGRSWTLIECGPENAVSWSEFRKKMQEASPGSPIYVPHPFPNTREKVIENFLNQYHEIWPRSSDLFEEEKPLAAAIAKGDVRFDILRVENWTGNRCGDEQERKFYYLLRIFNSAGTELARAALAESGLWATNAYATAAERAEPPARQARRLPAPAEAAKDLRARFGVSGSSPQYVASGGHVRCDLTAPCLAVRAGGSVYILSPKMNELFEIPAKARRARFDRRLLGPAQVTRGLRQMADSLGPEERMFDLGGMTFTVARRVQPKP